MGAVPVRDILSIHPFLTRVGVEIDEVETLHQPPCQPGVDKIRTSIKYRDSYPSAAGDCMSFRQSNLIWSPLGSITTIIVVAFGPTGFIDSLGCLPDVVRLGIGHQRV